LRARNDVGGGYLGTVDHHAASSRHGERRTLYCFDRARFDICCHDFATDDVVGQYCGKFGLVFEQGIKIGFWDFGKRRVSGGKNSERALAFEGVNQVCRFERGGQCVEAASAHSRVNNVLGLNGKHRAESQNRSDKRLFHGNLQ
jgi:hypothetical protein